MAQRIQARPKIAAIAAAAIVSTALSLPAAHAVPAAIQAVGAALPFTIIEAENSATNGSKIGPSYAQGTLAAEASNRQAVTLNSGQYVEFTAPGTTNAINVAYSIPDGRSGTLAVYVNGQKLSLAVTSKYSYVDTGWIAGSRTHKLYDHARLQLGQTVNAGAKIKLQVDGENTAGPYTIDDVEFENVAGPLASLVARSRSRRTVPTRMGTTTRPVRSRMPSTLPAVLVEPCGSRPAGSGSAARSTPTASRSAAPAAGIRRCSVIT
ncbi:hypothetical protein GCM10029976_006670 [Kribbella albertanoniae]